MASGVPFSEAEKRFIVDHAPTRSSWGALAAEMARACPTNGRRNGVAIRNFYRRHQFAEGKRETVAADIPIDIAAQLRATGLSPVEIGALVVAGLAGRSRSAT
jgi:hypothetical protein